MPLRDNSPCVVRAGLNIRALINPGFIDRLKYPPATPWDIYYFIYCLYFSSLFPAHRASASLARSGTIKGNTHIERALSVLMGPFMSP